MHKKWATFGSEFLEKHEMRTFLKHMKWVIAAFKFTNSFDPMRPSIEASEDVLEFEWRIGPN
jgi:hypothetical protein